MALSVMRSALVVVASFACIGLLFGSTQPPAQPAKPTVVFQVMRDAGMSIDGGLVIAGWSDGTVVFAMDPDKAGKNLQAGTITPEQLKATLDELNDAGFFGDLRFYNWPPDASHTIMAGVREGKTTKYAWVDHLSVPWGAHVGAEPKFKAFAKLWANSRTIMAFACPTAYKPIHDVPDVELRYKVALSKNEFER